MSIKIAVYAICKNEEKNVEGWLDNVKDADEIILCDTGSTDGTFDKAFYCDKSQWGAVNFHLRRINVMPFRFDTARNVAMSLVPPDVDVCISLDLDERLDPGWRGAIERAMEAQPETTRIWVNYQSDAMADFPINTRVHTRRGWRWVDPCHECIMPSGVRDVEIFAKSIWIRHKADRTKARGFYLPLLVMGINEEPWNTRRMFYLARELLMNFKLKEAKGWYEKYLEIWEKSGQDIWLEVEEAKAGLTVCIGALKELEEGRELPKEFVDSVNLRMYGKTQPDASTPA